VAELVALLDLGSNAVRFLLARVTPGVGFRVVRSERVQTRLGGGRPGSLPPGAVRETVRAVQRFLGDARNGRSPRVLAVATAAVREAVDRDRLLGPLRREGVEVRVLDSAEEARLGALAVVASLPVRAGLVLDLGGSSLQLTRLRGGRVAETASLPLGAVRTTRRFFTSDPPAPGQLLALRRHARRQLRGLVPAAGARDILVGLGGTVRTLASIHLRARPRRPGLRHGLRLRAADVAAIRRHLAALPLAERRRVPGIRAERADTAVAGAIVIEEAMALGGYGSLTVCTRGVRDGVLLQEAFDGRPDPPFPRSVGRGGRGGGGAC
jgi:exopolyphosphatase/guanosine-5'-triphosphate,3'-diphosphate pyrophosphatase